MTAPPGLVICDSCGEARDPELLVCPSDGAALPEPAGEQLPSEVGPYRILRRLGRGGMGSVYQAEHWKSGERVALKLVHRRYSSDEVAIARFFNEAWALERLGHDNIVKVIDLDSTQEGRRYLIMELLEGEPLDALIQRSGALSMELAGPIALQCCAALHAAHERGVIHRDLKPENIFLVTRGSEERFVKLVDFGIAQLDDGVTPRARPGMTLGTPWYMSPEQALAEPIDRRSDIYSLGVVLFEMATGRVPFPEPDVEGSMLAHVHLPPPAPRSLAPQIPDCYERLILRALAKEPRERQQTMGELRAELSACLGIGV